MELKMEVYSPALELLGLLEIQKAVIWEDKAFSAGTFSVDSLLTNESRSLLQKENIIWIEGETAGSIEYIHSETGPDGPYLSVKGRLLTGILDRRVLWGRYDLSGTPAAIMTRLVDDCAVNPTRGDIEARKIPNLTLADVPSGGNSIRIQKTGGSLLTALEELGETYNVAFGVRFLPQVPRMEFWTRPGVNRSIHQNGNDPVFYSTELDDVLSSEYTYNSQNYRNVALVAGEGEGDARTYITVTGNGGGDAPTPPEPPGPPAPTKYTVTVSVDPSGSGTVTGAGLYEEGAQATVTATAADGYKFTKWTVDGQEVGTGDSYTFTVTGDVEIVAVFEAKPKTLGPWTAATLPLSDDWYSVTYGNGKFVAVAFISNKAAYSADGVTWTASTLPSSLRWQSVTYGNGKFVAVANNSNKAAYSADGVTWTAATLPASDNWYSVTYGNGKYVAVALNSNKVAYSTDGVKWTAATLPSSAYWQSVTYGNGKFVAVATSNSNKAAYSTDGVTWTAATLPEYASWRSITYGNGKFVAVAQGRNEAAYSADGVTWTAVTMPSSASWYSVTYGNGKFVAVTGNTYDSSSISAYSNDGITWVKTDIPVGRWISVTYGDEKFVTVSYNTNQSAYCEFV